MKASFRGTEFYIQQAGRGQRITKDDVGRPASSFNNNDGVFIEAVCSWVFIIFSYLAVLAYTWSDLMEWAQ